MGCLGSERDKVPEHVGILQVGLGISLLGVDEGGEENGIPDEEDRRVVADDIPHAVVGVEFDGETARIACCVG